MDEKLPYFVVEKSDFYEAVFELRNKPRQLTDEVLAFAISIKKWELVAKLHEKSDDVDGAEHWGNCGLCLLNGNFSLGCHDCPVMQRTGYKTCRGTPYEDYSYANGINYIDSDLQEIANQELQFLKDLAVERGIDLNNLPEIEVVWEK